MSMCTKATIVLAHPDTKSTCASLAFALQKELEQKVETELIDLYTDSFNPLLSYAELRRGFSFSTLVQGYQAILRDTKTLVLVFPLWWGMPPAMLKGWFDRVLSVEFAYTLSDGVVQGLLSQLDTYICCTYHEQSKEEITRMHDHLTQALEKIGMTVHPGAYIAVTRSMGTQRIQDHVKRIVMGIDTN